MRRKRSKALTTELTPAPVDANEFSFDESTRGFISEINAEIAAIEAKFNEFILPLTSKREGAMQLAIRRAGLAGKWDPKPDGTGMIRSDVSSPGPVLLPPTGDFTRKSRKS